MDQKSTQPFDNVVIFAVLLSVQHQVCVVRGLLYDHWSSTGPPVTVINELSRYDRMKG